MSDTINWIHLTDLHLGLDNHRWLWPKVKSEFFKDIENLTSEVGGWDLVFFTGDLVNRGTNDEFNALNSELVELWQLFSRIGTIPKLCLVPGNHDLIRPLADSTLSITIAQQWWKSPELRRKFWSDPSCELRSAVKLFFANYTNWISQLQIPLLQRNEGILPGDFSSTFIKNNRKLGIVGLNSTFLQISNTVQKGSLELHVSQLNALCEDDSSNWFKNHDASVLLTHQPPSWLSPEALDHFREEIYPSGRYISQLCGHQHEPESSEISEAGAAPRRIRQGPSLFGLEEWDGVTPQKRIHGYTAGQFVFEQSGGFEKLWPRIALKGLDGGFNIAPDHRYKLKQNCIVTPFEINEINTSTVIPKTEIVLQPGLKKAGGIAVANAFLIPLLDSMLQESSAKHHLAGCARLPTSVGNQHRHIRLEEKSQFEAEIRKNRCIWIAADWGIGKEGFLISCIERFKIEGALPETFHIKCDDADDIESFEALFPQQCGMPLQGFCGLLAGIKGAFLILDGIHPSLCQGELFIQLKRIFAAILDYCSELRLVLVSRLLINNESFVPLQLRPLDVPDVRTYLLNHPDGTTELREADVVEKLHDQSDGLPMHLDKMLKSLKVSSLASVLESELEGGAIVNNLSETTPQALIHVVSNLAKSQDKGSKRSFKLLKVLSILPYGETIDALRHYLPEEPFFNDNAIQLNDLSLLDVVLLQQSSPKIGVLKGEDNNIPKLLKVPRQVRDYVQTLITNEEKRDIVVAGAERFFGRSWREGKVRLRSVPAEYKEYLSSGAGNEFSIVHHLIMQGRHASDELMVKKASMLGIQYARHLKNTGRYRDLSLVAGALTQAIDRDEYPDQWSEVAALNGEGLRMMDNKHADALKYLHSALGLGESTFAPERKASIWLDIALAESSLGHNEESVRAAEKVKEYSESKSAEYLHAVTIIAEITIEEPERTVRLIEIEKDARRKGFETIANNISLDLARKSKSNSDKMHHLTKVLKSDEGGYNHYRAIVAKAAAVQKVSGSSQLTQQETALLAESYSYFHAQRFSRLFDSCHDSLWNIFSDDSNPVRLLRLFRHSSFVWRIRGNEDKEKQYLSRLREKSMNETDANNPKIIVMEFTYYLKRLKVVLIDAFTGKPT